MNCPAAFFLFLQSLPSSLSRSFSVPLPRSLTLHPAIPQACHCWPPRWGLTGLQKAAIVFNYSHQPPAPPPPCDRLLSLCPRFLCALSLSPGECACVCVCVQACVRALEKERQNVCVCVCDSMSRTGAAQYLLSLSTQEEDPCVHECNACIRVCACVRCVR